MNTIQEDKSLSETYDTSLILRFLSYAQPHWLAATVALLATLCQVGLDLSLPMILKTALDGPIDSGNIDDLYFYVFLFTGVLTAQAFVRYLQTYVTNLTGQNMMHDLRMDIFSHLQNLSASYFDRNPVGRLVTRISNDVESLQDLFTSGLIKTFADLMLVIGIACMLIYLHWKLALVTFSVVPVLALISWWFRSHARRLYRLTRKKLARVNSYLQESLNGMKIVKIFCQEHQQQEQFEEMNGSYRDQIQKTVFYYGIFYPAVSFVSYTATALLIWYGGLQILYETITFGTFMAFWYYSKKFFHPLRSLSRRYNVFQSAMASSERIFRLLDETPQITSPQNGHRSSAFSDRIRVENMHFAYDPDEPVIRDVSFTVRKGERLALVGRTGSGKTTLIHLLMRLYDRDEGTIAIDGIDLQDWNLQSLRSLFGVVRQDLELFPRTLRENITLGRDIPRDQLTQAIEHARLDHFISRVPNGLDTVLGEEGETISRGQQQLISVARALAYDPEILVLDEATGSVDPATEHLIQKATYDLLQDRTSIIIAHRLSTIQYVDRILVVHEGKIVERGTFEELMEKDGRFADLYKQELQAA